MSAYEIPFNKPSFTGSELEYIRHAIELGRISGDGQFTLKCHRFIERELSVPKVLLTTSCTHALEMSALLLDVGPGDEVIIPSFTFVSCANAFALRGARPVFADIRPDTLNIDESKIERLVSPRTKAILVVHYAGVSCEMDAILDVAERHGIPVVEDNAHGLFGRYKGRLLGTLGVMATQSFHETKNITCGEGGALIVNDLSLVDQAEIVREKGTNRNRFFRGQVDKYTWVGLGSSYLPSEILAAFLYSQLESYGEIQMRRRRIWEAYNAGLGPWAAGVGAGLPVVPEHCDQSYHMFYLTLPSLDFRQRLIEHLKQHGILAVFHYLPLHLSEMGLRFGGAPGDCPVTEDISDRLLRLPFYNILNPEEQERVIAAIHAFKV
jgi:dTDP-4-amino-4,6-dideoxygalactose transaminase